VRRRDLVALLGGTSLVWPLAGRGQQPERMRRVGALIAFSENDPRTQAMLHAFVDALEHLGRIAGRNLSIVYRFAAGDAVLFKTYATELVGLSPDAILAIAPPAVAALQAQTHTIPIVFVLVVDPVRLGFVQSIARPGGNITGFSSYDPSLMGKWVELLKEIAPSVTRLAVIFNPDTTPNAPLLNAAIEAAASKLGITMTLSPVGDDPGIEAAIAAQAREPGAALVCLPNVFNDTHRRAIIAAAVRRRLPFVGTSDFPGDGGLMSYWFDPFEQHAQAASYIDRILGGVSPADLPVQQPTKYKLVINMKTANVLGITVPRSLLARADEVIE
jgi:putative ABC transport system substrate-binding protein